MRLGSFYLFILIAALVQAASGDRSHNIFDDDWTPPKPATTTRPPTPAKPSTPPPADPPFKTAPDDKTQTPQTPKETTTVPPVITPAPPAHLAVPSATAQAAVRKVMKEVFAAQLTDRSIPARRKLTVALLEQVDKSADTPVDQFVLLAAAIDSAIDAVSLPAALRAADKMAKTFDVDALSIKTDAAIRLGPKSAVPDIAAENIEAVVELSSDLARADDFAAAARVCAALQPATAGNPALRAQLQQRQREIALAHDAANRFILDLQKLKQTPNDPLANFSAGRYYCFTKGDWATGLPMLAKGSDPALKTLAIFELSPPVTPEEFAHLADSWWDVAAKQPDAISRAGVTSHAIQLYDRVVGKITGLRKVQIETRLAEAAHAIGRIVNEIVVEAYIDGATTLHITPLGIYWKNHGAAKPGMNDKHDELTLVNKVAWKPKWSLPGDRGNDTSDIFPLKIGGRLDFQVTLQGCADKPGTERIDPRDPISSEIKNGEFVVSIPDSQAGAKWYRVRIFHEL